MGLNGAIGEFISKVGDIAVGVKNGDKGSLHEFLGEIVPVDHAKPGMLLDSRDMLHSFVWIFGEEFG